MTYGASLDWLNFLLADVRGGLGPYVSVFLLRKPIGTRPRSAPSSQLVGSSVSHCIRRWVRLSTRPIGNGRSSLPAWLPCPYVRCRSRGLRQCRSCSQQTLRWLYSAQFSRRLSPRSRWVLSDRTGSPLGSGGTPPSTA